MAGPHIKREEAAEPPKKEDVIHVQANEDCPACAEPVRGFIKREDFGNETIVCLNEKCSARGQMATRDYRIVT